MRLTVYVYMKQFAALSNNYFLFWARNWGINGQSSTFFPPVSRARKCFPCKSWPTGRMGNVLFWARPGLSAGRQIRIGVKMARNVTVDTSGSLNLQMSLCIKIYHGFGCLFI